MKIENEENSLNEIIKNSKKKMKDSIILLVLYAFEKKNGFKSQKIKL